MPVRSLSSRVLRWPDREQVLEAAREWARRAADEHESVEALALYGSYARGDWGVGSDADLLAIVDACTVPFERRTLDWELSLPVPAELVIYTHAEWDRLRERGARIVRTVEAEAVWLHGSGGSIRDGRGRR